MRQLLGQVVDRRIPATPPVSSHTLTTVKVLTQLGARGEAVGGDDEDGVPTGKGAMVAFTCDGNKQTATTSSK